MKKKFPSFYNLIDEDPTARKYFNALPTDVKSAIEDKAKDVITYDLLRINAEKLTKH